VARKGIAVKKYVVTLSDDERDQLNAMINKGKYPARQLLKARILLKADASDAGEGWSDSQIAAALDTSIDTIARTRQRLVEEGLDGALKRHHSRHSARHRIFDGEAEAKLIALTRSPPPKGRARWTLVLLEDAVVERNIVARASDNTIGRTLKKTLSNRT
jgi:transposase